MFIILIYFVITQQFQMIIYVCTCILYFAMFSIAITILTTVCVPPPNCSLFFYLNRKREARRR